MAAMGSGAQEWNSLQLAAFFRGCPARGQGGGDGASGRQAAARTRAPPLRTNLQPIFRPRPRALHSLAQEFKGYIFKIKGGQDKQGFPMKQGVLTPGRVRILMTPGDSCFRGYGRRNGERRRKSVRGCIVSPDLSVLNLVIVKKGGCLAAAAVGFWWWWCRCCCCLCLRLYFGLVLGCCCCTAAPAGQAVRAGRLAGRRVDRQAGGQAAAEQQQAHQKTSCWQWRMHVLA